MFSDFWRNRVRRFLELTCSAIFGEIVFGDLEKLCLAIFGVNVFGDLEKSCSAIWRNRVR